MGKTLTAIYEPIFLTSSFGFRPSRNCHAALKILSVYIEQRNTNFIVGIDIKGFRTHGSVMGRCPIWKEKTPPTRSAHRIFSIKVTNK